MMHEIKEQQQLPPGFYFSPTDEQLVLHFLHSKASLPSHPNIIPHLHLSQLHPWELNGKALSSGNEYYFFTELGKEKSSTTTESEGYWMETGVTKPIVLSSSEEEEESKVVGMKKYLGFNFNLGVEIEGTKTTTWVMEEYHHISSTQIINSPASSHGRPNLDDDDNDESGRSRWVLCKVYEKKRPQVEGANYYCSDDDDNSGSDVSWLDEVFMSLDDHDLHRTSILNAP